MGIDVYIVMTAIGEMASYLPHQDGFAGYADRFVDPALGFSLGTLQTEMALVLGREVSNIFYRLDLSSQVLLGPPKSAHRGGLGASRVASSNKGQPRGLDSYLPRLHHIDQLLWGEVLWGG